MSNESMIDPIYPKTWYLKLANLTSVEFDNLNLRKVQGGYQVFETINTLYGRFKESILDKKVSSSEDEVIQSKILQQRLLTQILSNQTRLMKLIPKKYAEDRMVTLMSSVAQSISQHIKPAAARIANSELSIREIEELLTEEYNNAIDTLVKASEVVNWENDNDQELLQIQLKQLFSDNPELENFYEEQNFS